MVQVLDNLKQIRPEIVEERLQEMLEGQKAFRGSPMRKSEEVGKTSKSATKKDNEDQR